MGITQWGVRLILGRRCTRTENEATKQLECQKTGFASMCYRLNMHEVVCVSIGKSYTEPIQGNCHHNREGLVAGQV